MKIIRHVLLWLSYIFFGVASTLALGVSLPPDKLWLAHVGGMCVALGILARDLAKDAI
jgi:hypothetical protein